MPKTSQLLSQFKFIKELPKEGSASDTVLFVIRNIENDKRYIVKLFVETIDGTHHPISYKLLKHEIDVYRTLYQELKPFNVRNVSFPFRTVKNLSYTEFLEFIVASGVKSESQASKYIEKGTRDMLRKEENIDKYDITKMTYMCSITEMVDREYADFTDFLRSNKNYWTNEKLSKYMAIIVLTLYQMSIVGINQNDLHFGNILVSRRRFGPTSFHCPIYLIVTPNDTFIIDNEYTLFIFDFDRAAVRNRYIEILEGAQHGGNCPHFHKKRDLLRVICVLFQHVYHLIATHSEVFDFQREILDKLITHPYIRERIKNAYNACWLEEKIPNLHGGMDTTSISCIDNWLDEGMAKVSDILKFFFVNAKFKYVSTKDLIKNKSKAIQKVSKELSKNFLWASNTVYDPKNDPDLENFIVANIQYTQTISEKDQLVKNIIRGVKKTIQ
jgi:hypothetical protein